MKRFITNTSGSVLIVTLWILAILAVYSVSLGRRSHQELSLVKRSLDQLKARYLAWGGVVYSIAQITRDSQDEEQKSKDDLYRCAVALKDNETPAEIFAPVRLSDGYFEVGYLTPEFSSGSASPEFTSPAASFGQDAGEAPAHPGFSDEDRKINLNALNAANSPIFRELLLLLGADSYTADVIAAASVDWHDADSEVSLGNLGEEGRVYESLKRPYKCKNRPFDQVEELLLVKGMTPELFARVREFVTVFPKDGAQFLINGSTASPLVLRSLARSVTGLPTNTDLADADSLVRKLVVFRAGPDGREATADDRGLDPENIPLTARERAVYLTMARYMTGVSQFVRVRIRGVEGKGKVSCRIDSVIDRRKLSVVSWNRS